MKQKHNNLEHVKTARFYSKYFQGAIRFQSSKSKQTPKQSEKKTRIGGKDFCLKNTCTCDLPLPMELATTQK